MNSLTKALGIGTLVLFGSAQLGAQSVNDSDIAPINHYQTAKAYEDSFSTKKDTAHALAALDYFEKYYISAPDGSLACNALVKKADLLHKIGRNEEALAELSRIKKDSKCKDTYLNYIGYMERRLKRILTNNN